MDQTLPIKINGATSDKNEKEEKMRELQQRLQDKEAQKARELLALAGRMSHYEAFKFVQNSIAKKLGNGRK